MGHGFFVSFARLDLGVFLQALISVCKKIHDVIWKQQVIKVNQ